MNNQLTNRRKSTIDPMVFGKVPPQAKELEEAILGAIMLEKGAFDQVIEILQPKSFYMDANQKIFEAMVSLSGKNMAIDMLTVVEELKAKENLERIGGPFYVSQLTNSVVSSANIDAHCRIVQQKYIMRELIRISGEVIGEAYEDRTDVFDLLDSTDAKFSELITGTNKKNYVRIGDAVTDNLIRIEKLRGNESHITGIPSGFEVLDKITHGWQDTDLIILAARPSVGKTAFALNLARNAARYMVLQGQGKGVGFFSLEMSIGQLVSRILSTESEIWLDKINNGRVEEYEIKKLYKVSSDIISKYPIFIDDTPALNIFELRAKARRMKEKHGVGMIIIDYLQLMSGVKDGKNSNREQEISKISRDLKSLAKELQVPIIALSQLSREVEKRKEGNKIPQLSDLRESGAIEQDADLVMFLYRPEYYEITSDEFGESNKGETHVKIAKHRNGSLDTIKLQANLSIQKFTDYEGAAFTPPPSNFRPIQGIKNYLDEDAPF